MPFCLAIFSFLPTENNQLLLQREVQFVWQDLVFYPQKTAPLLQREVQFSILHLCSRTLTQAICDYNFKSYKNIKQFFWPLFYKKNHFFYDL